MPSSNENNNGNGNGKKEYNPEIEYEHVVDDVFYEVEPETQERKDVVYLEDILEKIEGEDSPEGNANN